MTSTEEPKPPPGLVAGKYRLTRLLGRGGMGTVWEGVHEHLGTRVAVKFIDSEHAASDDVRQRFVNEARAAARLRSKHVVQIYDQGVGDDGRPYIVMEFLAGEPLDHRLDREGRLAPEETARIALHVCRALARAHESGVVHRDLKPENVFLVRDEEDHMDIAKVVDFGIAKFTDPSTSGSSSTRTGAVLGTPQYMSPEQARGLRSVDHRTDLWALGVIVYRSLTGTLPFKGEAVGDLLVNICTGDVPVPSSIVADVPPGFDAWVRRALSREPGERFQSAAELSDALAEVCGVSARFGAAPSSREAPVPLREPPVRAVTASPFSTTPLPSVRSKRPSAVALGAIFVAVLLAAVAGARAVMRAGVEATAERRTPQGAAGPGVSATGVATPATPAVTPMVSATAAPSASDSERGASRPAKPETASGKHRQHSAPSPGEPKPAEKPAHKSERPPDLLGY